MDFKIGQTVKVADRDRHRWFSMSIHKNGSDTFTVLDVQEVDKPWDCKGCAGHNQRIKISQFGDPGGSSWVSGMWFDSEVFDYPHTEECLARQELYFDDSDNLEDLDDMDFRGDYDV